MALRQLTAFFLLLAFVSATAPKCYGLAMEGGGSHGAYEAGVMKGMTQNLPADEVMWNIITGISTGALNSVQAAYFDYGDEAAMADHLIQTWQGIKNQNMIAPFWPGSTLHSLLFRQSLTNRAPLEQYLYTRIGTDIVRNVSVGATNLITGLFTDFDQSIGRDNLITATLCSAAAPLAFAPVSFENTWFVDGGVTLNLDAYRAIKQCRDMGYADENIVMDLYFDWPYLGPLPMWVNTTKEVMERATDVQKYFTTFWFIGQIPHVFPDIDFRYMITPSQHLPPNKPGTPLDFNPADIEFEVNLGMSDALNAINMMKSGLKAQNLQRPMVHYFE
jgi:predicted acylesterase/phospholipase RssA